MNGTYCNLGLFKAKEQVTFHHVRWEVKCGFIFFNKKKQILNKDSLLKLKTFNTERRGGSSFASESVYKFKKTITPQNAMKTFVTKIFKLTSEINLIFCVKTSNK